uniref:Defensin-like protein n=1 Tax=Cajanus cajan TaxID=3821 RepID=A0A151T5I7_CAJCA|nr:Defensin-like protein 183 family [Cajanus cajan]
MANQISNYSLVFIVLTLIITGSIKVKGSCSQALGACGPLGDCDGRCKAQHSGGQGSCDLNLCTCYYNCGPPNPPSPKICNAGLGLCSFRCNDDCCNSKCASKYYKAVGMCNTIGTSNLCTCQYVCR